MCRFFVDDYSVLYNCDQHRIYIYFGGIFMKLNEVVSARFNCTFPIRYNQPAVAYYCEHVRENFPSCLFIFELMAKTNDYTLHRDELRYMCMERPIRAAKKEEPRLSFTHGSLEEWQASLPYPSRARYR